MVLSQGPDPEGKSDNGHGERDTRPAHGSVYFRVAEPPSNVKRLGSQQQDSLPTQEGYRTKFYEMYREEAGEYDREFIKRYDEDLNTTLIFVRVSCHPRLCCADLAYRPVCSPP